MSKIKAVCVSDKKGPKHEVDSINLIKEVGVEGDFHAKGGVRQVSLLSVHTLEAGAYGENILVEGLDLKSLPIGQKIDIGGAILEITQIGKRCSAPCEIGRRTGDCIMPREGIFAKVIQGGIIKAGDEIVL